MKKFLLLVTSFLVFGNAKAQSFSYLFNNNFNEQGGGRILSEILSCGATSGGYSSQTLTTSNGSCGFNVTAFDFTSGGGVEFPNADMVIGSTYTIHVFFTIKQALSGYTRLIDFSNSASDAGIYILGNCLNFFPSGNVGPNCPFVQNEFSLLTLVRDGTTGEINVYINGVFYVSYSDASNFYVPNPVTVPIRFFRDDNAVACESKAGTVKYISLSNTLSTAAQVAAVYSNICAITLPVTWAGLKGSYAQGAAQLSWQTLNEQNSSYFEVQRSINGISFSAIGKVQSKMLPQGSSYLFKDINPAPGTYYYRIKQVDKNGAFTYSATIKITVNKEHEFVIYPNPVKDQVTITGIKAGSTILMSTMDGRQVITKTAKDNYTTITVASLPAGVYLLRYHNGGVWGQQKIVKE